MTSTIPKPFLIDQMHTEIQIGAWKSSAINHHAHIKTACTWIKTHITHAGASRDFQRSLLHRVASYYPIWLIEKSPLHDKADHLLHSKSKLSKEWVMLFMFHHTTWTDTYPLILKCRPIQLILVEFIENLEVTVRPRISLIMPRHLLCLRCFKNFR